MKVSVIMPLGGEAAEFASEALDSLRAQSLEDWQVIIHPDKEEDIEGIDCGGRIKVLDPAEVPLTESRNKCLEAADGEYVAVLDSDDLAAKERLEWQATYLDENPEIDLIAQSDPTTRRISENGDVLRDYDPDKLKTFESVRKGNPLHHSTVMFRNKGYRYREKFKRTEDFDLYLRIADDDFGNIKAVSKDLGTVRETNDSVTRKNVYESAADGVAAALMRIRRQKGLEENYEEWDPSDNMDLIREIKKQQNL